MIDEERLKRLPRWAQDEISSLRMSLERSERDLERMTEAAGFREERYGRLSAPAGMEVVFRDGTEDPLSARLIESGALRISGTSTIGVLPQAANVVRVRKVER